MAPSIVSMSSRFNGPSLNFCLTLLLSYLQKKIVNQVVINFEIDLSHQTAPLHVQKVKTKL